MKRKLTTAYILSIIAVIPIFFHSISPLIGKKIHEILSSFYDLFSTMVSYEIQYPIIIVVLFIFIVSLILSYRGSYRARLVWLGSILYFIYVQMIYFLGQILFYSRDGIWDMLLNDSFEISNAYIIPLILSIIAFIIGLKCTLKEDPPRHLPFDLPTVLPALLLLVYSMLLIIMFLFWAWIDYLSFTIDHNFRHLGIAGAAPLMDMVFAVPLFIYCFVSILKRREIAPVFVSLALFKAMTPVTPDYLWHMIDIIITEVECGMLQFIDGFYVGSLKGIHNIITMRNQEELRNIWDGTSLYLNELIVVLAFCSIILFILFHREIGKRRIKNTV